jgi:carboxyl-terminal processing protease
MIRPTKNLIAVAAAALVLAVSCDPDPDPVETAAELDADADADDAPPRAVRSPVALAPAREGHAKGHELHPMPAAMPGARQAFDQVMALVQEKYVEGPMPEDELWTAAINGVMAHLVQLPDHEINKLMAPDQLNELMIGTEGRMVGVGIMIEEVADVVVVRGVIPGGPAERAGLQPGDRILGVDGERITGETLSAVVKQIRGEEGTTVELFVQRDTEEWNETITRGQVMVDSVQSARIGERIGYLRITSFSRDTPTELDQQLQQLTDAGAKAFVLDLRACPGGLLETSLEVAERWLPSGSKVVTVRHRDGTQDVRTTSQTHAWASMPLAVLIGPKTASGAEILADALHEHRRVPLIGDATVGKHTVEAIHELEGGWAVKMSVSRFESASGESRQGIGVVPDIHIAVPEEFKLAPINELDPATDPVLAAGAQMLSTSG